MAKDIVIVPASGQIEFSGSNTHHNVLTVDSKSISITTDNFIIDGGNITAQNYIVSSSVTHMTTSFSSGSTVFGNSYDDIHAFSGSIQLVSGSPNGYPIINLSSSGDIFSDESSAQSGKFGKDETNYLQWSGIGSFPTVALKVNNKTLFTYSSANNQIVINETGENYDFRVESDGDANFLYLDAADDTFGIGAGSDPPKTLTVGGDISASGDFYSNDAIHFNQGMIITSSLMGVNISGSGTNAKAIQLHNNQWLYFSGSETGIRSYGVSGTPSPVGDRLLFKVAGTAPLAVMTDSGMALGSGAGAVSYTTGDLPATLTINGEISSSGVGYVNTGWHGSQTRIKIMGGDFSCDDDTGRPMFVEDDTTDELSFRAHGASSLYATIVIPEGFKATAVMVYGSDSGNTVECWEGNINAAAVTSKGSGNVGTEVNITDVSSTDTNFLWVEVTVGNSSDLLYGGYVTIEKI